MENVEVKLSSIEGYGVFTTRTFRAGEHIRRVNIVREVTAENPLRAELGERYEHCAYPDGKVVLWGFPDRHVNHSCDPNAYEYHHEGHVYIVARRDVAAGEEVTVDYNINISGGDSWPCQCGSDRCQGKVMGDYFHLPKAIQYEYRLHLADWFVNRHADKIERLDKEREK